MRESAARRALSSPIAMPLVKDSRVSASRSASVAPSSSTSTSADEPPEMRNSGCTVAGSSSTQPSRRCPAASERSSGSGCALKRTSTAARPVSSLKPSGSRVMMRVRSMAAPRASCAPSAMAVAALPMAASHTGPGVAGGSQSAARTQRRPSTRARPACSRPSSSSRRGSQASAHPQLPRTILSLLCRSRRASLAASERSSCSRSRYSGVTSPVT